MIDRPTGFQPLEPRRLICSICRRTFTIFLPAKTRPRSSKPTCPTCASAAERRDRRGAGDVSA